MAINITEMKLPWTPKDARDYIQSQTDAFGVFIDVDRCFEISGILQLEMSDLNRQARRLSNNPRVKLSNKQSCIDALVEMGVPRTDMLTAKDKPGLNAEILDRLQNAVTSSEEVKQFATLYSKHSSHQKNKGFIEGLCYGNHSTALSKKNHRMARCCPKWQVLSTSRISASDPGVQGIPRTMGDIICEPKGYTLIRCDSGQIEPRINWSHFLRDEVIMNLITYYDDAYFGLLHYCSVDDATLKGLYENFDAFFTPLDITDEIKDKRQTVKRLTNAASYGSSNLGKVEPGLAINYEKRIVNHPKRKELEYNITKQVRAGDETFYGAFGTPVTPDSTERYSKNDKGWINHVVRGGINNPVQTTASELMLHSVYAAREIIAKAKDTHICFYKHDEACFYVSDEDMANGVGDVLSDITAYNVKGWIPIKADPLIGVKKGDFPSYIL